MSQPRRVDLLIVGGGVAAARCARTLRRGGFDGSIHIVGDERLPPYNRPPLSKELLLVDDPLPDDLLLAEGRGWYERQQVDLRTDVAVTALDPDARLASLSDGTGVRFDRCVLATGAAPRPLPVPGAEHALLLRTAADARRLRAAMDAHRGEQAVVVGGGFIGVEVASALAARGLRSTIVELAPFLWGGALGPELATWARDALEAVGATVRTGTAVTRLDQDAAWIGDERLPAALIVAGVGVSPRVELARAAGLAVDDGITVDATGKTSHSAIWAAGDVARVDGLRVEHWHAAREAGERVGAALLGGEVPAVRAPWVFSEVAGTTLDVFGVAGAWDEARWIGARALAYLDGGRLVQLATIGGSLPPEEARDLVERAVDEREVAGRLGA